MNPLCRKSPHSAPPTPCSLPPASVSSHGPAQPHLWVMAFTVPRLKNSLPRVPVQLPTQISPQRSLSWLLAAVACTSAASFSIRRKHSTETREVLLSFPQSLEFPGWKLEEQLISLIPLPSFCPFLPTWAKDLAAQRGLWN